MNFGKESAFKKVRVRARFHLIKYANKISTCHYENKSQLLAEMAFQNNTFIDDIFYWLFVNHIFTILKTYDFSNFIPA